MSRLDPQPYIQMEKPTIIAPLELLKRNAESQIKLNRRVQSFQLNLEKLQSIRNDVTLTKEEKAEKFNKIIVFLKELKEGMKTHNEKSGYLLKMTRSRINQVNSIKEVSNTKDTKFSEWSLNRVNRVTLDYLLRCGYPETAKKFSEQANLSDMGDMEIFQQMLKVKLDLKNHSCKEALAWCNENKKGLAKFQSSLELHLRLQEYLELVRKEEYMKALKYMGKHLKDYIKKQSEEVEQYTGLLAFPNNTECYPYKKLYSSERWQELIQEFQNQSLKLFCLPQQAPLILALKAGLTSLKTPFCLKQDTADPNCPCCNKDTFAVLANPLPDAYFTNSSLKCNITGTLMDDHNPPMVLPNGKVVSKKAIDDQKAISQYFKIPNSDEAFDFNDIKKVFIS